MNLSHTETHKDISEFGSDTHLGLAIGIKKEQPVPINLDNVSPIFMVTESIFKSRSKHIKKKREINVFYVPCEKLIANALTKSLPAEIFVRHVMHMGLGSS